jgi:hypothetical protein
VLPEESDGSSTAQGVPRGASEHRTGCRWAQRVPRVEREQRDGMSGSGSVLRIFGSTESKV